MKRGLYFIPSFIRTFLMKDFMLKTITQTVDSSFLSDLLKYTSIQTPIF